MKDQLAASTDTLERFFAAWNRHDIDAIMSCMTEDCIFETPAGPEVCGTCHVGAVAFRKAVRAVLDSVPDAQWRNPEHHMLGEFGVSTWMFTGTAPDGTQMEVNGVDLLTFRDGKICVKNAFRKKRTSAKGPMTVDA